MKQRLRPTATRRRPIQFEHNPAAFRLLAGGLAPVPVGGSVQISGGVRDEVGVGIAAVRSTRKDVLDAFGPGAAEMRR